MQFSWQKRLFPPLVLLTFALSAFAFSPVAARHGMVASSEALASEVGVKILRAGGNAVDAAVAVGFTLAVTYPTAGNIGGGGFMLIRLASGEAVVVDYREAVRRRLPETCMSIPVVNSFRTPAQLGLCRPEFLARWPVLCWLSRNMGDLGWPACFRDELYGFLLRQNLPGTPKMAFGCGERSS